MLFAFFPLAGGGSTLRQFAANMCESVSVDEAVDQVAAKLDSTQENTLSESAVRSMLAAGEQASAEKQAEEATKDLDDRALETLLDIADVLLKRVK